MIATTTRPETDSERLTRLQRSLDYNESKSSKANGVAAAALRREIVKLMRKMEGAR